MPRRVLLITVGNTPQIVTETIYELLNGTPPWVPDEIVLVTTATGEERFYQGDAKEGLAPLFGVTGKLTQLYNAVGGGGPPPTILDVPPLPSGNKIRDLRSPEEVESYADHLMARVKQATEDADTELHLSLAGGRKTQSYLAGAILSLFGRPQDRLSHVLVEPPELEEDPDFWWRDTKSYPHAQVNLCDVPFARLKGFLGDSFSSFATSFASAVAATNVAAEPHDLCINMKRRTVRVGMFETKQLEFKAFAVFRLLIAAKLEGWPDQTPGIFTLDTLLTAVDCNGRSALLERFPEYYRLVLEGGEESSDFVQEKLSKYLIALRADINERDRRKNLQDAFAPLRTDLRGAFRSTFPAAIYVKMDYLERGIWGVAWPADRINIL